MTTIVFIVQQKRALHYLQLYNSMVELLDQKVEEISLVDNELKI
jgi:hypothetical protein